MTHATRLHLLLSAITLLGLITPCPTRAAAKPADDQPADVRFETRDGQVDVLVGGRVVATYVYQHAKTHRPFFKDVKTPSGVQVTRNHPPVEGKDRTDHPDMHPGLWLAFGDLGGQDFWRNKGPRVEHERFSRPPKGGPGRGTFEVANRYVADGRTVCRETARYTFVARPAGYLILWDSTFTPGGDDGFDFGNQEEMGLGLRVASGLAVKGGSGGIRNSRAGVNEKGTWGESADWCDYAGTIDGRHVGVTLMVPPGGATRPWFHSRDYGLLVANPFGSRAGADERLRVAPGEAFRLKMAVLVHESERPDAVNVGAEYLHLVKTMGADDQGRRAPGANSPSPAAQTGVATSLVRCPSRIFVESSVVSRYLGIPMEFQQDSPVACGVSYATATNYVVNLTVEAR
jgi:hypothetical protein